jgi:Arm DNA-binding domain
MGLGAAGVVGLAEARQRALEARQTLKAGKNPIAEKREAMRDLADKTARDNAKMNAVARTG